MPTLGDTVSFKAGTASDFAGITPNDDTFYIIDDKIDFRDSGPQVVITMVLNMLLLLVYGLIGKIFIGEFVWQGLINFLIGSLLTGLLLPLIFYMINKYLSWGPLKNTNEAKRFF